MSYEKEIEYYDNLIQIIEKEFKENYDILKLEKGQDEVIKIDKMIVTLSTIENQKSNINHNMTRIDFGDCETLLRKEYNISTNETLYMKKIDIEQEGMTIPKVEYDVYSKAFGKNLIKLNLTACTNSKITIFVPFKIKDDPYKYNISSGYYNDICYSTTSEDGTDISIKDRQKDLIDKDYIACQEDCDFSGYDINIYIAECLCNVKESHKSFADMNIDKTKLVENFINIKNIVNYKFLVCYKKLMNNESLLNNIGCYIILVIILFHIIVFFIFNLKLFPSIKKRIDFEIIKTLENKNGNEKNISKKDKFALKEIKIFKDNKKIKSRQKFVAKKKPISGSNIKINLTYKKQSNKKVEKKEISNNYNDEEINGLSYYRAIIYDKRTYWQYYASLLKTQHNLICVFFNNNYYNSGIIKLDLFFIGFAIEYTINGLFFNDDTMHKIYKSKGKFDFSDQIPIIVYSTLISMILNIPLNLLALSNNISNNLKQNNTKYNIMKKAKNLKNILTIKFSFYFIIGFLYLLFFWYYISLFNIIYKNTQMHLLKDTLISIGLALLIPFEIYLLPGFFRIPALSNRKSKRICLYNFSKFLQSIWIF